MNSTKVNELSIQLQSLSCYNANQPIPFKTVLDVREGIASVAQQISGINPLISNHLVDLKNALFTELPYQRFYINLIVYGQTIEAVDFVKGQILATNQANSMGLCRLLHPNIQRVSEKLYRDGSYAEAYPDSENVPDGQALMNKVFADNDPVFEAGDRTTQTGKDIHLGTRFLFAGAMAALRNPKSHENIELEKDDSMRRMIFASMLMFKIDEIIAAPDGNG